MQVELLAVTPQAELLIELAGRTAYQSQARITDDSANRFIRSLISRGHLSVLEHASATFRVKGASRAFTHQIVRHRLCSFTQESQRYVDESNFTYVEPDSVSTDDEAHALYTAFLDEARHVYDELQRRGIRNEDARFVLPNAVTSEIVITANFRQWRHIVELRASPHAQWEVRQVVLSILSELQRVAPACFADFIIDSESMTARFERGC